MLIWSKETVSWDPPCSYLLLNEAIRGGLSLNEEVLELVMRRRGI